MKITNVITDSNVGGAGVLVASVAEALCRDYAIEIIIPRGSALRGRLAGCGAAVVELDFSPDKSFNPGDVYTFHRYFLKNSCDILHTHASFSARLGSLGTPVGARISTRHCAHPTTEVRAMSRPKRRLYDLCTDLTVSTADFATENLIREGVARNKIFTLRNGVCAPRRTSDAERAALRESLGIPRHGVILGSAARLEFVKGQDLMIRAMKPLLMDFPNLYLLLVGDGSARSEYERLAARLGVLDRVIFFGYTPTPATLQNLFYINLNASRGTETSCLATSECMSLGIPTVASDFGGNPEMILNERNGLLFRTDNPDSLVRAVKRLLSSHELYRKLSLGAEAIFKSRFSIDIMAEGYRRLYEDSRLRSAASRRRTRKYKKIDNGLKL